MRREEAGSTLLLVPSAVLVLLLLAALVVDAAATFLAQRELADACAGAANDAATAALDQRALHRPGAAPALVVDPELAVELARSRARHLGAAWGRPVDVRADGDGASVALHLRASAPLPIGAGRRRAAITASCAATALRTS